MLIIYFSLLLLFVMAVVFICFNSINNPIRSPLNKELERKNKMEQLLQVKKHSTLAIISLILSVVIFIPLTGLAGLIVGIIALVKISKNEKELKGKGLAIAGTIIGGIRTILLPFVIIGIVAGLIGPGVFTAREEALKTQVASNMRQIGIALYAHAKNNDGMLPATLAELETEGYIEDMALINDNIDGNPFTFNQANNNLYSLNPSDALVTDDIGNKATNYVLRGAGSVDTGILY